MTEESDDEERQVMCSRCLEVVPESRIRVIPHYNDTPAMYVTTYRCEPCFLPSLDETRARLVGSDDTEEIASLAAFFERYGLVIHEARRGDPVAVVRKVLGRTLDLLRENVIRLSIGPTA
jgi:hypothetical protein